jgi:hypothetical protein
MAQLKEFYYLTKDNNQSISETMADQITSLIGKLKNLIL